MNNTQLEIFQHFQLEEKDGLLKTHTFESTKAILSTAIIDNKWEAFSGRIGSGKTETILLALRELHKEQGNFEIVEVLSPDRKKVMSGQLLSSFVHQQGKWIGTSAVRRDNESRLIQVTNILKAAHEKGKKMVLLIDEAHELHSHTLNVIKRLRDTTFIRSAVHLPVIMLGQPHLSTLIENNEEVRFRIRNASFGYTRAELIDITHYRSYGQLSKEACALIVDNLTNPNRVKEEQLPTPLELERAIELAFEKAYKVEAERLSIHHFVFPEHKGGIGYKPKGKVSVKSGDAQAAADKIGKAAS